MNFRLGFATLILGLLGATAQADDRGFYVGSGAGVYYVDFDGLDFDQAAPTVRLFGGYRLNRYIGFEGGFSNLFEISEDVFGAEVDMKGTSWDLTARPTLPLGDRFEVFGVLGYSWYDWKIRASFQGDTVSDNDSDSELLYGLGAAWQITDAWALRGEWTMVDVSDADFGMVSAAVTYRFN